MKSNLFEITSLLFVLSKEELEATYLKIYLRALKLTPEELKELKKKGHRYEHLEEKGDND